MSGMDVDEDGDIFFDDDFENIPDEELQRLEHNAIVLTQQDQPGLAQHDKSFSRVQLLSSTQDTDAAPVGGPGVLISAVHNHNQKQQYSRNEHQNSSDGAILDEDGLPLTVEELPQTRPQRRLDETTQREQWRVNRFGQRQLPASTRQLPAAAQSRHNSGHLLNEPPNVRVGHVQLPPPQHNVGSRSTFRAVEEDALRSRINELMRERDELTTRLRESKDEVVSRKGEIANLRAKQSNDEKALQRQMALLQKLKQEDEEKHVASMQAMNAENSRVASEVQFLKQELKEETLKAQMYQRQLKERPLTDKSGNINTTPNRNRSLRDGFDDDEMMVVSPVKSGRKSKQGTPTANRKRKQPTAVEPHVRPLALRLSGADSTDTAQTNEPPRKADSTAPMVHRDRSTMRHLSLLQKVTNFRPGGSQEVLIERLFKLSFPNETNKTLGTITIGAVAKLQGDRLPGDLLQVFVDLWSRALKERYYRCIALLIEVVSFILDEDPLIVDKVMLSSILPVLEATITINATARFKLMQKEHLSNPVLPKPTIDSDISNTSCLELLYTFACLSYDDSDLISLFWRSLSTDFVLMMLNGCQTIPDLPIMLKILGTSILPETFSNITEVTQQARYEGYTIDRVCYLLSQLAKPDVDKPPYSQKQLCYLRQESLNFLTQLTLGSSPNPFDPASANNYGTKFIANHTTAIARLVRCIYDELAAAYLGTPSQHLHIDLVNTAIRILHFVLFSPAGSQISWQLKFSALNGGVYKFRVAMARLAYAEGGDPGIDTGVTEDTIRMATELLEDVVTPDEVDDIVRVFEGESNGGSRKASALGSTQR